MTGQKPLPRTSQWGEARGFERIYHDNPFYQARFAMALCGLREEIIFKNGLDEECEGADIVGRAIKEFVELHGEFLAPQEETDPEVGMGPYTPDPRLVEKINMIIGERGE